MIDDLVEPIYKFLYDLFKRGWLKWVVFGLSVILGWYALFGVPSFIANL